jgi:class 3 adenylate cyclase
MKASTSAARDVESPTVLSSWVYGGVDLPRVLDMGAATNERLAAEEELLTPRRRSMTGHQFKDDLRRTQLKWHASKPGYGVPEIEAGLHALANQSTPFSLVSKFEQLFEQQDGFFRHARLVFADNYRELELDFRAVLAAGKHRLFATVLCMGLTLLIAVTDTLMHRDSADGSLRNAWFVRITAVVVSLILLCWERTEQARALVDAASPLPDLLLAACFVVCTSAHVAAQVLLGAIDELVASLAMFIFYYLIAVYAGMRFHCVLCTNIVAYLTFSIAVCVYDRELNYYLLAWHGTLFGFLAASAYLNELWQRRTFVGLVRHADEQSSTEAMLRSLLPDSVARRLNSANVIADKKFASVLFSDVVKFTQFSSSLDPEHVVSLLNILFSLFDHITEAYGVYKVETIGDAYVACVGVIDLPSTTNNRRDGEPPVARLIDCGTIFTRAAECIVVASGKSVNVRVGIHTGVVIAGVVGKKMPRYHLFGDTVIMSEHMEQSGVPGRVVVSSETHALVSKLYEAEQLPPTKRYDQPRYILHERKSVADAAVNMLRKSFAIVNDEVENASSRRTSFMRRLSTLTSITNTAGDKSEPSMGRDKGSEKKPLFLRIESEGQPRITFRHDSATMSKDLSDDASTGGALARVVESPLPPRRQLTSPHPARALDDSMEIIVAQVTVHVAARRLERAPGGRARALIAGLYVRKRDEQKFTLVGQTEWLRDVRGNKCDFARAVRVPYAYVHNVNSAVCEYKICMYDLHDSASAGGKPTALEDDHLVGTCVVSDALLRTAATGDRVTQACYAMLTLADINRHSMSSKSGSFVTKALRHNSVGASGSNRALVVTSDVTALHDSNAIFVVRATRSSA